MRNPICHVVGAGDFSLSGLPIVPGDLVIAADGGYRHLAEIGVKPDLVIGDFDSLDALPESVETIQLNPEKDITDTMAALDIGLKRGYGLFMVYGGMGGRMDHTLANIQAMVYLARRGARGYLIGDGDAVTAIADDFIAFRAGLQGYLSVFCHGETAEGVTETGLKYSLNEASLTGDFPLGVSNEFTGVPARVSVSRGALVILWRQSAAGLVDDMEGAVP